MGITELEPLFVIMDRIATWSKVWMIIDLRLVE